MASCAYCGSTIIFGGERAGDLRFCNSKCLGQGQVMLVAQSVPDEVVTTQARSLHAGPCPICNEQRGPVDVHLSHKIHSFIVMTSYSSTPQICCRSCGLKKQLGATAYSLFLGWWGFPWGILMTPVQIGKNVAGMLRNTDSMHPSPQLEKMVRLGIAAQAIAGNQATKT